MHSTNLISQIINNQIEQVLENPQNTFGNSVSKLISFGELVDKLTICNNKLFKVKDQQADLKEEESDLAIELVRKDIALCKERSQIKRAIDFKLREIIKSLISDQDEFVAEEKLYG